MDIIPGSNPYIGIDVETLSGMCRLRSAQLLSRAEKWEDLTSQRALEVDTGLLLIAAAETISICAEPDGRQGQGER